MLFLLQYIALLSTEGNSTSRSSYFEIRENKQLEGYVVKRFDSPSLLSCGQQCLRNACCTSTNYKMSSRKDGKGTCELNKYDISLNLFIKSIQTSLMLKHRPPKPYKLLKFFVSFVTTVKSRHSATI